MTTTTAVTGTVLIIWAVGTVLIVATVPAARRAEPSVDAAFVTDPVRACLLLAVVAVLWPALPITAGLLRLADRGRR